jgi:hypothetical protein
MSQEDFSGKCIYAQLRPIERETAESSLHEPARRMRVFGRDRVNNLVADNPAAWEGGSVSRPR